MNPNAFVLPGIGAEAGRLNMSKLRERAKTLYLDYQSRARAHAPWMAGKRGKEMRSYLGDKPAGITFSTGISDNNRWKDSVLPAAELKIWVHTRAAHGLRPKVAKFAAAVHDRRWLQPVEEIYTFLWKAERYLRNTGYPLATVGTLFSHQTPRFYRAPAKRGHGHEDYSNGMYQALIEARIPNDAIHEDLLDESGIERFRVLVLPNVACLSDRACDRIRRFVEAGGGVVATHESSLYNETGKRRPDFRLADLFGVSAAGEAEGPIRNSYIRFNHASHHPALAGFDDAGWMINGIWRQPVRPSAAFPERPFLRVAPFPDLPMEEVLDVTAWRQERSLAVHLVNLTNPMLMRGAFREIYPVGAQQVRLRLPAGAPPKSARLLERDSAAEFAVRDGWFECRVPGVRLHEIVAIDL